MSSHDETLADASLDRGLIAPAGALNEPAGTDQLWSRGFVELLAAQFVFGLGFSAFFLLPKYLRVELSASGSEIGVLMGAGPLAAVLATPPTALWLARGGRAGPAQAGLFLLSASALAFGLVEGFGWALIGLRLLQGAAFTLFISAVVTRAAELVPKARLAQAMGYIGLASLVTNALSPMLAESLAARHGWSPVFLLAAACGLMTFPFTRRIGRETCPEEGEEGPPLAWWGRELFTVLFAAATCGTALGVLFTFTQPLALERGAEQVGDLFTGYVAGATAVRLLLSNLADRLGRRRVSAVTLFAYALVVALTLGLVPEAMLWAGLGQGICHGLLYPALNALALERTTLRTRGIVATLFGGAFNLGYAVSVLLLGVIADSMGYAVVFFGTAFVTMTGSLALLAAPRTPMLLPERGRS